MTRFSRFASVAVAQRVAVDVTGTWTFAVVTENGTGTPAVVLTQKGEQLTGTYESSRMGIRAVVGTVKKDSILFVLKGGDVELTFAGVVTDKDHMHGNVDMGGQGSATFTGTRKP
jgi:type II secretory pathway component PulC